MVYKHNKNNKDNNGNQKVSKYKVICTILIALILMELGVVVSSCAVKKNGGRNTPVLPDPAAEKVTRAPETPAPEVTLAPSSTAAVTEAPTEQPVNRRGSRQAIPQDIRQVMAGKSMPSGATVGYDDLAYLTIPHYDFNYNVTTGHLIVSASIADEVLDIFAELYDIKYPIERMEIVDNYNADDYASIDANNTSAFNYRLSTDGSGRLSNHAKGLAIDINPKINPYVNSSGKGAHSNAAEYWSRDYTKWSNAVDRAAYIGPESEIYRIFMKEHSGWEWGGSWSTYRDYQHFQKKQ